MYDQVLRIPSYACMTFMNNLKNVGHNYHLGCFMRLAILEQTKGGGLKWLKFLVTQKGFCSDKHEINGLKESIGL